MAEVRLASDEAALTHALTLARASGAGAPACDPRLGLEAAYRVQQAVFAASNATLAGYKLAATSAQAQSALGIDGPLVGLIATGEVLATGAVPPVPAGRPVYAEVELVLRLGEDLPVFTAPPPPSLLAGAIDGVFGGIEICASRCADDDLAAPGLVADNALLHMLVLGDRLATGWDEALATLEVVLDPEGAPPILGAANAVMGHPLRALAALAQWLGTRGTGLRRGQIVASGSMTGITEIAPDARVTARFGPLGLARATLVPPTTRSMA